VSIVLAFAGSPVAAGVPLVAMALDSAEEKVMAAPGVADAVVVAAVWGEGGVKAVCRLEIWV
jgi:hypothetical protein